MANQPAMVKQADIKRIIKGAIDAGVDIDRIEVEHGKVIVFALRKQSEEARPFNSCDFILNEKNNPYPSIIRVVDTARPDGDLDKPKSAT